MGLFRLLWELIKFALSFCVFAILFYFLWKYGLLEEIFKFIEEIL